MLKQTEQMMEDLERRRVRAREIERAQAYADAGKSLMVADDLQAASDAFAKAAANLAFLAQQDKPPSPG